MAKISMARTNQIPHDRYLIIIGSMKSGTTSFFDYLARHDAICPSSVKEPEYFSEHQGHKVQLAHYEDLWAFEPQQHRYALEASTGYTKMNETESARAMRAYGLQPRFLYIVRDPLKRIESHYNYIKKLSDENWSRRIDSDFMIGTSNYYLQAEKFANEFGRDSILAVKFEDWVKQDEKCVAAIWSFLELQANTAPVEMPKSNQTSKIPSRAARTLGKQLPTAWLGGMREPVKNIARSLDRLIVGDQETRLSEAQKDRIRQRLAPEMDAFARTYGIDISSWGFR